MVTGKSLQQYAAPTACYFILPNVIMFCLFVGGRGEEFHKMLCCKSAFLDQRRTTAGPCISASIIKYVIAVLAPVILLARLTVPPPGYEQNTQHSQQLNVAHTIRSR